MTVTAYQEDICPSIGHGMRLNALLVLHIGRHCDVYVASSWLALVSDLVAAPHQLGFLRLWLAKTLTDLRIREQARYNARASLLAPFSSISFGLQWVAP